jgi:hypothetical protein
MAQEDGTTVSLRPTSTVTGGGGVPSIAANTPSTITLSKGQYAQIEQQVGEGELNGTIITSNYPIGVFGGATCMNVPDNVQACDSDNEQIPPVRALGHEYAAVKYRDRFASTPETPPWRIVGVVNGTTLTWDPSTPAGAPNTISAGQMVEFQSGGPFVVSSQDENHPFYMAQYMTGCAEYCGSHCTNTDQVYDDYPGDPEVVNMIPPEEYLDSYVLFTDPTYSETELVVIRAKGSSGFEDVTLDCVGTLTGWQPIDTAGKYEYTRADLVTGDFMPVGACNNGRHMMSSNGSFGVTVWGWGSLATGFGVTGYPGFYTQAVRYAYPAGESVKPINPVVLTTQ